MIKPRALGNETRQANKKLRRERIFDIAKQLIAANGLDDFTIAELAQKSGVTTPTIHNLFGKKDDIAAELIAELVLSLKGIMSKPVFDDPIESATFYVNSIVKLYSGSEDFYRSAYMAAEKAGVFLDRLSADSFYKQSISLAEVCCDAALNHGYLSGKFLCGNSINVTVWAGKTGFMGILIWMDTVIKY
jgi:AcrR family transcriptional regulator